MATQATKEQMAEAVAGIRLRMAEAARAAGRDPSEVLLCAACKTRTVEEVRESATLDIDLFGENHVQELVELGRLRLAPLDEQAKEAEKNENAVYGYIFRLYRLSNTQYLSTFMDEACRLMGWAHRKCAAAEILFTLPSDGGEHLTYDAIHTFSDKEHRKPYYKRDYILLTITDPVAQQLEKMIAGVSKKL